MWLFGFVAMLFVRLLCWNFELSCCTYMFGPKWRVGQRSASRSASTSTSYLAWLVSVPLCCCGFSCGFGCVFFLLLLEFGRCCLQQLFLLLWPLFLFYLWWMLVSFFCVSVCVCVCSVFAFVSVNALPQQHHLLLNITSTYPSSSHHHPHHTHYHHHHRKYIAVSFCPPTVWGLLPGSYL